jgi:hypothetical protein
LGAMIFSKKSLKGLVLSGCCNVEYLSILSDFMELKESLKAQIED